MTTTLTMIGHAAAEAVARIEAADLPAADSNGLLRRATAVCEAVTGSYNGHYVWPLQHPSDPNVEGALVAAIDRDHHCRAIRAGGPESVHAVVAAMIGAMEVWPT